MNRNTSIKGNIIEGNINPVSRFTGSIEKVKTESKRNRWGAKKWISIQVELKLYPGY
jgi:hypothetical protein